MKLHLAQLLVSLSATLAGWAQKLITQEHSDMKAKSAPAERSLGTCSFSRHFHFNDQADLILRMSKRDEPCFMTSDIQPWFPNMSTASKSKKKFKGHDLP